MSTGSLFTAAGVYAWTDQVKQGNSIQLYLNLSGKDNCNDEPVDSNCFTEDDRDQILGFDPWGLHTSTDNAGKVFR